MAGWWMDDYRYWHTFYTYKDIVWSHILATNSCWQKVSTTNTLPPSVAARSTLVPSPLWSFSFWFFLAKTQAKANMLRFKLKSLDRIHVSPPCRVKRMRQPSDSDAAPGAWLVGPGETAQTSHPPHYTTLHTLHSIMYRPIADAKVNIAMFL